MVGRWHAGLCGAWGRLGCLSDDWEGHGASRMDGGADGLRS